MMKYYKYSKLIISAFIFLFASNSGLRADEVEETEGYMNDSSAVEDSSGKGLVTETGEPEISLGTETESTEENLQLDSTAEEEPADKAENGSSAPVVDMEVDSVSEDPVKEESSLSSVEADGVIINDSSSSGGDEFLIVTEEEEEGLLIDSEEEDIFEIDEEISAPSVISDGENTRGGTGGESDSLVNEERNSRYGRYRDRYRERDTDSGRNTEDAPRVRKTSADTVQEDTVMTGPAEMSEVKSINFAKGLEGYRSPKRAMLLSLLLPGLGQAYSKKYVKSVIYGTVEAVLVGFAIKFSVDGKNRKEDAHAFADKKYSQDRFEKYYDNLKVLLENRQGEDLEGPESVLENIYYDDISESYDRIQQKWFVQGWDDCEPRLKDDGQFDFDNVKGEYEYLNLNDDSAYLLIQIDAATGDTAADYIYGYSDHQKKYNNNISIADKQFRIATGFLFGVLVNHVVSAVDALFSARQHNLELLGRQSFLERFDILHSVALGQGGVESYYGLRIRF